MIFRLTVTLFIVITTSWAATISGHVKNGVTGKSIPNANVYIRETGQGTTSSSFGYFKINLPSGTYLLETSVIGFRTDIREIIVANENIELGIDLQVAILKFSEVKVKGLFFSRLGHESIDIISAKEIKAMEKESLSDVLREIPGVDVQFAQPNGRNVNVAIRGSSDYKPGGYNNRVLILLDGFPILIPNSGSPDWNSLPLESIQRIEVDNSPASAQYGHNSMGGVINLITDDGNKKNNTIFRFSRGSHSKAQTSITHSNQKENIYYNINASTLTHKGHRFNAANQTRRLRTFLRHEGKNRKSYQLSHIVSYSDIGHPGFTSTPSYRKSKRLSQYIQGRGFYSISEGLSMSQAIFFNKFDTHYYDRNDTPEDDKQGNSDYDDLSIGLRSEFLITKWTRLIFMIGTDLDWSKSEVDVFNSEYKSPSQLSVGGFIQSKYSIGNGWKIGLGLRYDYRRTDPGENFLKGYYTNWSPKANITYARQNIRAFTLSYSEGFRAPSLSELYLVYISPYELIMKGNLDIIPEKVSALEAMYEHTYSNVLYWKISLFNNMYKNMIDFIYDTPSEALNREDITAKGFEYQFKWEALKNVNISGSYAFLFMSDQSGDPILYRSKHSGQFHLKYDLYILNIQLGVKAWSEQTYYDFLDRISEEEEKFKILPTRMIPELIFSNEMGTYTGALRISNLSNTQYELIQDYPMPGRTWQFTLTKTITKELK